MADYRFSELLIYPLFCDAAQCGHQFRFVVGELKGRNVVMCPDCGHNVNLKDHRAEIDELLNLAAELDKRRNRK
jgi:DNA-directed RNA polymerase subunit RPC12/RpoP